MFAIARAQYAFNGIAGKEPDWDAINESIRPRIVQAESAHEAQAYFLALRDFTQAFQDGNVDLGGDQIQVALFQAQTEGGYGLALRELDEGRVLVSYVMRGGPADVAGIQLRAQVTAFNGQPISDAINAVTLWDSLSLESSARYQRLRYLLRAPLNTSAAITFTNPGAPEKTATLLAIAERASFSTTSYFVFYDPTALPVESKILPSGAGYIKLSSTSDNPEVINALFETALNDFADAKVSGLIIDLRVVVNLAASLTGPLGLAGFLNDSPILLGQIQTINPDTGKFENSGPASFFSEHADNFKFDKIILLVGPGCSGLCELEAHAITLLPDVTVIGQFSTAGTYSDITLGQFLMPEGFKLQIPTGRFVRADGGLLIEGQGIPLTIRVAVDESTVFTTDDVVLQTAEAQFK